MEETKNKGIVFFDLDGTLLDNRKDMIPQSALRALRLLKQNGYVVALSTGRDMDNHYSKKYQMQVEPDAIVHLNGIKITVGDQFLFDHYMDEKLLGEIAAYAKAHDICFGTTVGKEDFYTVPRKRSHADAVYNKYIQRNYVPFDEIFRRGLRVRGLSYAGDLAREKAVIEARFPEIRLIGFTSQEGADVVERGYSKAEGMKKVCAYYGLDAKKAYAFGDSLNDMEIIKAVGCGIAMGNAVPELKAGADYVTDPIDQDGIWNACRHFGLIECDSVKGDAANVDLTEAAEL